MQVRVPLQGGFFWARDEGAVPDEFVKQFAQRLSFEAPKSQSAFLRAVDFFAGQVHQLE